MVDVPLPWLHHKTSFSWRKATHTHTSSWCTKQHVFSTLLRLLHFGGSCLLGVQKKRPFWRMGSIWNPQFVGWTAEVIRKTELIFYILLVLQESWIHPKKLTWSKNMKENTSADIFWLILNSSSTWFSLLFWYQHPYFKMLQSQRKATSTSINVAHELKAHHYPLLLHAHQWAPFQSVWQRFNWFT